MIKTESGAQIVHNTARNFLIMGIINTIVGILITILVWPGGIFSVVVGVIELVNAALFWPSPPKRNHAPMYVAVLEIINIISLGSLWSLIVGIINVNHLKNPEVKAFFEALQRGEVLPIGSGLSSSTDQYKKCPKCAELIQIEAFVCRYCGHQFNEADVLQAKEFIISQNAKLSEQIMLAKLQKKRKRRLFWGWVLVSIGGFFFFTMAIAYLFPTSKELRDDAKMGIIYTIIFFAVPLILWGFFLFRKAKNIKQNTCTANHRLPNS